MVQSFQVQVLRWCAVVALVALASVSPAGVQKPPVVAAAASMNAALTAIAAQFEQARGRHVDLVFGASGALTRQIRDGAPFEVFLAADDTFPQQLTGAGLTRDAGVVYAIGRLALFAPTGSPLTVDAGLAGLASLVRDGRVTRFAIANPEVAPYGQAAEAVLRRHGLWDAMRPRIVLGDSVAQAAQFATTGNAVGGLVAWSVAVAPAMAGRGTSVVIPASDHPPIRHRMVLLKRAGAAAAEFYAYLQTPAARAILKSSGFEVPE